jgi:hypothetical protein
MMRPRSRHLRAAALVGAGLLAACSKSGSGPTTSAAACGIPPQGSTYGGTVVRLGSNPVNTELSFTVPPGTAGFTIVSQAVSAADYITVPSGGKLVALENTAVPLTITQPNDGGVVYDDTAPAYFPADPSGLTVYFGGTAGWTGTLTVPNTSKMLQTVQAAGGLPAGTWKLVVNDWANECGSIPGCTAAATGTYDITVLLQPMYAPDGGTPQVAPSAGTVDLALYFASETIGLSAALAPANANVQRMVAAIKYFLGNAGLVLGTVSYFDVPPDAKVRYSTVNADGLAPCSDLSQLFAFSNPGNTLNLFLVDHIYSVSTPAGFGIAGLDGTIPGPSTVGGTVASGAAVSAANLGAGNCTSPVPSLACGSDFTGYVATHEAGHFLGLYHTTEMAGDQYDPLTDTGQCPCAACAQPSPAPDGGVASYCAPSAGPTMLAQWCNGSPAGCAGADNLMFWLVDRSVSLGRLTPEQGLVVRANPLVH